MKGARSVDIRSMSEKRLWQKQQSRDEAQVGSELHSCTAGLYNNCFV
jgi:hypothetical protein